MDFFINYYSSIITLFVFMFGFGLINSLIERQANTYTYWNFGKLGLFLSSFIGTTIHELSHAFFVVLFGNNITDYRLFPRPSQINNGEPLGYVRYSYQNNFLGMLSLFFIGIGPILGGPLIILVLLKLLVPTVYSNLFETILFTLGENKNILVLIKDVVICFFKGICNSEVITDWKLYVFIFLAGSIACHVTLSWADIKNAIKGFLYVFIFLVVLGFVGFLLVALRTKIIELQFIIISFSSLLWVISFLFSLLAFLLQYILHIFIRRI